MTQLKKELLEFAARIDEIVSGYVKQNGMDARRLWDAMKYSTTGGGKRIRPYLTYKVAEVLSGNTDLALTFGVAVEMVHTYSLIHDDLPCMDNDDYRRGKLTCHKMFDEATALLAGDGLLTMAFEIIALSNAADKQKVAAIALLAGAAGCRGMIGGQAMDLAAENTSVPLDKLNRLYDGKTGALIRAAVGLGCIAADCFDGEVYDAFEKYASALGLTFQIVDDILDVTGSDALGKPIGSDEKNGKSTYLSFMSVEEAKKEAGRLTKEGIHAISSIAGTERLHKLAEMLLKREK